MELFITNRKSNKTGNEYIALLVNSHGIETYLTFDERTILRVASSFGYSRRDIYNLGIDEKIICQN